MALTGIAFQQLPFPASWAEPVAGNARAVLCLGGHHVSQHTVSRASISSRLYTRALAFRLPFAVSIFRKTILKAWRFCNDAAPLRITKQQPATIDRQPTSAACRAEERLFIWTRKHQDTFAPPTARLPEPANRRAGRETFEERLVIVIRLPPLNPARQREAFQASCLTPLRLRISS